GPCGPDSEIFFDTGVDSCGSNCNPGCSCGKYVEIWNNVFIEFNRLKDGSLEKLKQQNIDTGMGVERTTALLQGFSDVFKTEIFSSLIEKIEEISRLSYKDNQKEMRIVADHTKSAVFAIGDRILPSNIEAGYIVRRLIRRAITASRKLSINDSFLSDLAKVVIDTNKKVYPHLTDQKSQILVILNSEEEKFAKALIVGEKWLKKTISNLKLQKGDKFPAEKAFIAVSTFGLPVDYIREHVLKEGFDFIEEDFEKQQKEHKKQSQKGLKKRFAGGMADNSEAVVRYHTATHLLHKALRDLLGDHVRQVGSNITSDRLRFDFTHDKKLTDEEILKLENVINEKVKADLPVVSQEMTLIEAKKAGALAFFVDKYDNKIKVYSIGGYSKEVCGGPHVQTTAKIGKIKIVKQKAVAQGRRRLYLKLAYGS
ncbi:MAG: alanine--tRNA ligase-related protein, partial [Patescibacteria group bacterium]